VAGLPRVAAQSRVVSFFNPTFAQPSFEHLKKPAATHANLRGARMDDDIHTPTVASGPTSGGYSNGIPKEQLSLQELMAEKDRLETELKALGQVLDSVSVSQCAAELELMLRNSMA
jgi:hypothetical protein